MHSPFNEAKNDSATALMLRQLTAALPFERRSHQLPIAPRFADELILVVNPCPQADPPARLLQWRSTSLRSRF